MASYHRWVRSSVLAVALACVAAGAAHGRGAAVTGPSLEGEDLRAITLTQGTVTTSGTTSCDPAGTSTVSFTADGPATGPYPGTFHASGTATIGPQVRPTNDLPLGDVLSFDETFSIQSGNTTVTGTKHLYTGSLIGGEAGLCADVPAGTFPDIVGPLGGGDVQIVAPTQYDATISGAGGTFTDTGLANDAVSEIDTPTGFRAVPVFDEPFVLSFTSASTPGHATGGGQLLAANGSPRMTFAFTAHGDPDGTTKGTCQVIDHTTGDKIHCDTVDTYFQSGSTVVITGQATLDTTPTRYQIEAFDDDSSGTNSDTFSITTDSGYSAAGVVTHGSIEVH